MGKTGSSASLTIAAPHIFDGADMRGPGSVRISQGRIESVTFAEATGRASIHLPRHAILAPGFIDTQVNGGGGVLLNDQPTEAGVQRIVAAHRKQGTTGCLPTLITDRSEVIAQLAAVAQACLMIPGVLGFHLEGPALNRSRKGIHPEAEIRVPRCKGRDRLMLVTDAMPLVGTNDRQFMLQGRRITLHDNRLTGPDGKLAGAHLTMIEAVRNAVALLGVSLVGALVMASRTPAAFLGLESELGRITPGCRADLVAFNPNFEVVGTWIGGVGSTGEASR
jgi:N-acetylglucosamine-6-phosphate deacetylase